MTRPVVLHVVESYGAGTASALDQYVRATPELEHHLIRRYRPDDDHADDGEQQRFASVADLGSGVLPALRSVRARVRELRPDVVHGHSSFGGLFARLAPRRPHRPLIVHTPHCYATERQDISGPVRLAYRVVERVLGARTDVVAGCSEREVELAASLAPRARREWVVNVTDVEPVPHAAAPRPLVATVGRIAPQRDPDFFADVVVLMRASVPELDAVWIGGGDAASIARLEAAGVEVTGWQPRSLALGRLSSAGLYVHTARWDGAPMTLIEARAAGPAIVARRTPAVTGPGEWVAESAEDAAALGVRALSDEAAAVASREAWASRFADHTVARQRASLLAAYGLTERISAATP